MCEPILHSLLLYQLGLYTIIRPFLSPFHTPKWFIVNVAPGRNLVNTCNGLEPRFLVRMKFPGNFSRNLSAQ